MASTCHVSLGSLPLCGEHPPLQSGRQFCFLGWNPPVKLSSDPAPHPQGRAGWSRKSLGWFYSSLHGRSPGRGHPGAVFVVCLELVGWQTRSCSRYHDGHQVTARKTTAPHPSGSCQERQHPAIREVEPREARVRPGLATSWGGDLGTPTSSPHAQGSFPNTNKDFGWSHVPSVCSSDNSRQHSLEEEMGCFISK